MAKNENLEKAEELYKQGLKLVDIATQLNVPQGTIRRWKSVHKWGGGHANKKTSVHNKSERSEKVRINKALVESVESNENLTDQQRAFCLHYVKSFNATMSYLRAYGAKYSVANSEGPKLLVNPRVRSEITQLKEIRSMGILATADDVVDRYMKIAFADITDFVEFGRATVPVMGPFGPIEIEDVNTGEKSPLTKVINDMRFKESSEIDGTLLSEVKQSKDGASVKLADRMKALEWLANYFELSPSDRHKREYDQRRLEIELMKTQLSIKTSDDESVPDDGFKAALDGQAEKLWDKGDNANPEWEEQNKHDVGEN